METYEKKYKEAQKWIESIYTELSHERQMEAEAFFSELKESEDERIRKTFIRYVKDWQQGYCTWNSDKDFCNDAITWLEKQKPTDKTAPKFIVGDWIINNVVHGDVPVKIKEIGNYSYLCERQDGVIIELNKNAVFEEFRHWDISDAKEGDVLYSLDSKQPFIFKHRKPHEQAAVYCGINIYGKFFVENTNDCIITADKYIPADEFQCDLLFEKMNVAGYEWDAEKKKLKKIEKKSAEENKGNIGKTSSNWSEEDVNMCESVIDVLVNNTMSGSEGREVYSEEIEWLKSLKEKLTKTKGGEI